MSINLNEMMRSTQGLSIQRLRILTQHERRVCAAREDFGLNNSVDEFAVEERLDRRIKIRL